MAKPAFQGRYYTHRWAVQKEFNLSPTDALVAGLIDGLSHQMGYSYASKGTMAKTVNVSVPTLNNAIRRLKEKCVIEELPGKLQPKRIARFTTTAKWNAFISKLASPIP